MDVGYLKAGLQGTTAAGKTTTAALIAIGLHRYAKMTSPVAFYDTERGSGFVKELFDRAGIKLVGTRSRSFNSLRQFLSEAEASKIEISIIDSITHPWRELLEAWKKKSRKPFIDMRDWGKIKEEWHNGYSIPYVNNHMHIIMCGRSANVFEDFEDEEATEQSGGRKKFKPVKVGTKMATEGETGYEPNLLMEMERVLHKEGGAFDRVATVLKDRSFKLDGRRMAFTMPEKRGVADVEKLIEVNQPFQFILPHIQSLDLKVGATAKGIRTDDSQALFDNDGDNQWSRDRKEKELLLGNIQSVLTKHWPGLDAASKKAKMDIIEATAWATGTKVRNWDVVEAKFPLAQVKQMYIMTELLLGKSKPKVEEILKMGIDPKGKVLDAEIAVNELYKFALGFRDKAEDDLPF